jgi:hypothetical protein
MSANTEESIDDRVAQLITQPLHPELFKPSGAVTQGQVLSAFGNVTVGLHIDVIAALVEKVQGIKTDVRSWGLHQVRAKIVKNFNQCSPGGSFCTIGQVADYWKENGTVEAAGKLWYACYGAFDDEPGWDVQLEQMYMEMCEYTYRVTEDRRKGCFARTIGQRKTDIIKMINRASEKTHQGLIRMKRLPEEIDEKTKFKKRKKGTTLGGFVKLDGQIKYEPGQVVTSVLHKMEEKKVRKCLLKLVSNQPDSNSSCCYRLKSCHLHLSSRHLYLSSHHLCLSSCHLCLSSRHLCLQHHKKSLHGQHGKQIKRLQHHGQHRKPIQLVHLMRRRK